jgi:hypothetical protein
VLRFLLVVAALLKAADAADRSGPALAVAWLAAAVVVYVDERGAVLFVPLVWWSLGEGIRNEHMWLFGWVGVVVPLTRVGWLTEAQFALAARWQVGIVYGFAGLSKVNPDWLSGDRLAETINVPVGAMAAPLAWSVVLIEVALAVLVWWRPGWVWPVGLTLHVGMVLLCPNDLWGAVRLACFAALLFALYPPSRLLGGPHARAGGRQRHEPGDRPVLGARG